MTRDESPTQPWTFDQVHAAIKDRFADTPYAVTRDGSSIKVQADLVDKTYLTWARANHVEEIRGVEITGKKGKATTRDYSRRIVLSAGTARLSGRVKYASGRQWSVEKKGDYTFSTSEIQKPVNEVLKESGWYAGPIGSLPGEARAGAVVALLTLGGLVVAGLVLLVLALG